MTWSDSRLTVNQIKAHPFFYGADWNSLRHIEPPFVPHLQSITDTSYFPTDDLGNLPDQLEKVEGIGAEKDLAFFGYAYLAFKTRFSVNHSIVSHSNVLLEVLNHLAESCFYYFSKSSFMPSLRILVTLMAFSGVWNIVTDVRRP